MGFIWVPFVRVNNQPDSIVGKIKERKLEEVFLKITEEESK
ncbi:unnamed protein product [marine sediment metagenome]|uniref:Uncharacterized protein n=1 Tax=marine sediment metagenome TaxID=412755 RepID=X1DNW5_9ZZZZ